MIKCISCQKQEPWSHRSSLCVQCLNNLFPGWTDTSSTNDVKQPEEYAVYKGDDLIVLGTAKECADFMNVSKKYIVWLATPQAKKVINERKNPENATIAIKLDYEEAIQ